MRQDASTISWAQEGEEWIRLAQTSDQRLYFVMPYMLDKLQDVAGKNILDLGCGKFHCICSGNCVSRKLYHKKRYYGRRKNTCIFSRTVL